MRTNCVSVDTVERERERESYTLINNTKSYTFSILYNIAKRWEHYACIKIQV